MSHIYAETTPFHDDPNFQSDREMGFNPYSDYVSGPNAQPPPSAFHMGTFRDRDRRVSGASMSNAYDGAAVTFPSGGGGHQHSQSLSYNTANSHEPLLGAYRNGDQRMSLPPGASLPPSYASNFGHVPQGSSSGSSPLDQQYPPQVPVGSDARSSVYSAASGDPMVMPGVAISTDDLDHPSIDEDPFAAVYNAPKSSSSGHGAHDDRLDATMLDWMGDDGSARDLKDEEDYSRRVRPLVVNNPDGSESTSKGKREPRLGVRNVTDADNLA